MVSKQRINARRRQRRPAVTCAGSCHARSAQLLTDVDDVPRAQLAGVRGGARLRIGSSRDADGERNRVHLVVTSPPF